MIKDNYFLFFLKNYYFSIITSFILFFLYPKIHHGDHEFYKLIYNNHQFIFDNPFFMNDEITGFVCEYFFGIILILSSKLISFNIFNFLLDLILFTSLVTLLRKFIKNNLIIFLFLICSSYFFSTALSSVRAELFMIFFILSIININKTVHFYIFFYLYFFIKK